jgi:hypothetical protein
MNENDNVNHPAHYTSGMPAIEPECIDFSASMDFCQGNAFKYVWRAGKKKDAIEDLQKAIWYLERCKEKKELKRMPVWEYYLSKALDRDLDDITKQKLHILANICSNLFDTATARIRILISDLKKIEENKE